jgi:hypothetical protein
MMIGGFFMAIRLLEEDLNIIAGLSDEPNDEEGLSAAELKARFDAGGNAIKDYINDTLIPDVGQEITDAVDGAFQSNGNMPLGGAAGDVLVKRTGEDLDAEFRSPGLVLTAAQTPVSAGTAAKLGLSEASAEDAVARLADVAGALGGVCATAAASAAKTVTIAGFALSAGVTVRVRFSEGNTATGATLNVSGAGAKAIQFGGAAIPAEAIAAGMTAVLQYDGAAWVILNPAPAAFAPKLKSGTVALAANTAVTVTTGFRPSAILCFSASQIAGQPGYALISGGAASGAIYFTSAYAASTEAQRTMLLTFTMLATGFSVSCSGATTLYYTALA